MEVIGINLAPPQEIKRKRTRYVVGASTKVAAVLLFASIVLVVYFFTKSKSLEDNISALQSQQKELSEKIMLMSEVEEYAKKLSGKYFLLQKYLESRLKYSLVISELSERLPTDVSYNSLSFEGVGKRATISGTSKDAIAVSTFVSRLVKEGSFSSESATLNEME